MNHIVDIVYIVVNDKLFSKYYRIRGRLGAESAEMADVAKCTVSLLLSHVKCTESIESQRLKTIKRMIT